MPRQPPAKAVPGSANEHVAEPGTVRQFMHPDGRTCSLEVNGCRVREAWTLATGKGPSSRSTRDDVWNAHAFALDKVRELVKKGYVEGEPRQAHRHDRDATG